MKKYFFVVVICLITTFVNSQNIISLPTSMPIPSVTFQGQIGLGAGGGGIWKTTNNGLNWVNTYNDYYMYDVKFIEQIGYAVNGNTIIKTTNAGTNWQVIYQLNQNEPSNFRKVAMRSESLIYVVYTGTFIYGQTTPSRIIRSLDYGNSWMTIFTGCGHDIRDISVNMRDGSISFVSDFAQFDTLWASRTGMQWLSWSCPISVESVSNNDTSCIFRINGRYGFAATATTNTLENWDIKFLDSEEGPCINSCYANGRNYALVVTVGGVGKVYKEIGSSWNKLLELPSGYSYYSISCNNNYLFLSARMSNSPYTATILRYDLSTIGIENGQENVPQHFQLNQNYPNPFNPVTKINYSVSKNSVVILKVYDVAGKEISTLVNKNQSAGNYSLSFDGSKLSSGVYFYRLIAGDFTETKKMMLIK